MEKVPAGEEAKGKARRAKAKAKAMMARKAKGEEKGKERGKEREKEKARAKGRESLREKGKVKTTVPRARAKARARVGGLTAPRVKAMERIKARVKAGGRTTLPRERAKERAKKRAKAKTITTLGNRRIMTTMTTGQKTKIGVAGPTMDVVDTIVTILGITRPCVEVEAKEKAAATTTILMAKVAVTKEVVRAGVTITIERAANFGMAFTI